MFGLGDDISPIAAEETTPLSEDPLSEADIYLAYGKYADAVRVLSSGLVQEPNNADFMLKLLEVYGHQEDEEAFKSYVQEVLAAHPDAIDHVETISSNHFGRSLSADDAKNSVIEDESDSFTTTDDFSGEAVEEANSVADVDILLLLKKLSQLNILKWKHFQLWISSLILMKRNLHL